MGDDFDIFPLAVTMRDEDGLTIELRRPDTPGNIMPPWGNECLWTDPPPAHCFKTLPKICRLSTDICNALDNGPADLTAIMMSNAGSGTDGKVAPGTDLSGFSPKLIAIIRTIEAAAKEAEVDLEEMDIQGLTIKFIDNR